METFTGKVKKLLADQEVRITAAVQLILCFLAITSAVKRDFRIDKKKKRVSQKNK